MIQHQGDSVPAVRGNKRLLIVVLVFSLGIFPGCTQLANYTISAGISEMAALSAVGVQMAKYPYVDFNQIFPETYVFDLSKKTTWNKILASLRKSKENVLEKDFEKGFIFTEAKLAPIDPTKKEQDFKTYYYQYSIFLTKIGERKTYVTCYPTMLEGENKEVMLPVARNWLRGIFFGALAAEVYPDKKRKSLKIAQASSKYSGSIPVDSDDVVHIMARGETLGEIARKYTGNVMNYKKILLYNNLKNANTLRVGQEIRIPPELMK